MLENVGFLRGPDNEIVRDTTGVAVGTTAYNPTGLLARTREFLRDRNNIVWQIYINTDGEIVIDSESEDRWLEKRNYAIP